MPAQEIPLTGYRPKLLNRVEVAEGTMAFQFEKPPEFDFKPGQSADLTFLNPPETDSEGNVRTFSIASAPFEDQLMFVTRMRDTAFKRSLKKVPLGTVVKMDSAMGSFTLHKNSAKPAVFLAGGIGITPFSSIVRQADHDRAAHKLYLFYSNRRPEETCFIEVLQNLEKTNPNFTFIATMTDVPRSKKTWNGEPNNNASYLERGRTSHLASGNGKSHTRALAAGCLLVMVFGMNTNASQTVPDDVQEIFVEPTLRRINRDMLSKYLDDLRGPIYYIAGPPAMVGGMRKMLVESGVDEDDIRTDEFAGY